MKTHIKVQHHAAAWRNLKRTAKSIEVPIEPPSPKQANRAGRLGKEQGQSVVEFALILPLLLLLTTGVFIFGVAMNNYLQLTNAVSVGARAMAINAGVTKDPCATGSAAIIAAAPGLSSTNLTFTFTMGANPAVSGTTCSSTSTTTGYAGELSTGPNVTVTATYPLNLSVYGKVFNANNAVLSATSTELVQ